MTIPTQDPIDFYKSTLVNHWTLQKIRAFNYWNSYKTCSLSVLETMGLGLQQDDSIARHSTTVNSSQVSKAHYSALLCIILWLQPRRSSFPSDTFVQQNSPYSIHHHTNSVRLLPALNMSFVLSVITAQNNLPNSFKHSSLIPAFKCSLYCSCITSGLLLLPRVFEHEY